MAGRVSTLAREYKSFVVVHLSSLSTLRQAYDLLHRGAGQCCLGWFLLSQIFCTIVETVIAL